MRSAKWCVNARAFERHQRRTCSNWIRSHLWPELDAWQIPACRYTASYNKQFVTTISPTCPCLSLLLILVSMLICLRLDLIHCTRALFLSYHVVILLFPATSGCAHHFHYRKCSCLRIYVTDGKILQKNMMRECGLWNITYISYLVLRVCYYRIIGIATNSFADTFRVSTEVMYRRYFSYALSIWLSLIHIWRCRRRG